jgi:hypothetical protein
MERLDWPGWNIILCSHLGCLPDAQDDVLADAEDEGLAVQPATFEGS